MLNPTRMAARRSVRSWWREHVLRPIAELYQELDERQQEDDGPRDDK